MIAGLPESGAGGATEEAFVTAVEDTVKNILKDSLDPNVVVKNVIVTSINGNLVRGRRLTQGEVLWEAILEAVTTVVTVMVDGNMSSASVNGEEQAVDSVTSGSNSAVVDGVTDSDSISNLLLTSVAQAMNGAVAPSATGGNSFAATFQTAMQNVVANSDDPALSAALTELIETIEVTGVATDTNQEIVLEQQVVLSPPVIEIIEVLTEIIETLVNATWYPVWETSQSHECLNDGNAPFYMKNAGLYFEKSRASCCKRFFDWDYYTCAGNSPDILTGFYPDWDSNKVKCVGATDIIPDYMRKNPKAWIFDTVESCCQRYYRWDQTNCISNSGSNLLLSFTRKFYVNHMKQICQQDCPVEEGEGRCGGPVDVWKTLYDTAKKCCEANLSWITTTTCEVQSSLGASTGSSEWYVDWGREMCVKDCNASSDVNCGGLVRGNWDKLYATAAKCCARLFWIDQSNCTA